MGGLKRKRSFDMSSPSTSRSSPQAPSEAGSVQPSSFAFGGSSHSPEFSFSFMELEHSQEMERNDDAFNALIHGRTKKRFRDGRPDEEIIYQNTLDKLFAAQRNNSDLYASSTRINQEMGMDMDMEVSAPPPSPEKNDRRQRTLHSFWNIAGPPPPLLLRSKSEPTWSQPDQSGIFVENDGQQRLREVNGMLW